MASDTQISSAPLSGMRDFTPYEVQLRDWATQKITQTYEKYGFTTRISANYNSEYILFVGEEEAQDLWLDSHLQFDFLARYQITEKFSVYMEMINLSDEPYRVYEGTPDRVRQEEYYGWWGTIGFRFDL